MQRFRIFKLIGLVIATMIVLVSLSFLEVAVYSMLINTGQDPGFYEAHAQLTAPWVSGIGGFIVFFLVVRYWSKKSFHKVGQLAALYPTTYLLIDLVIILTAADVEWGSFIFIFISANGAKYMGSLLAYKLYN